MKSLAFYFIVMSLFTYPLAAQTTITFAADKDNTMYQNDGSLSNGAGSFFFAGQTNNAEPRRGLIKFDLSIIPNGATISNVILKTFCAKIRDTSKPVPVNLHRVLQDWGETTMNVPIQEGKGTIASSGDATWTDNFSGTSQWTNPGGDYDTNPSANIVASQDMMINWSSSQIIADVQNWTNGASNHGWVFIGDEVTPGSIAWFNSRENLSQQPVLEVTYTTSIVNCNATELLTGNVPTGTYQASNLVELQSAMTSVGSSVIIRAGNCILINPNSEIQGDTKLVIGACQ